MRRSRRIPRVTHRSPKSSLLLAQLSGVEAFGRCWAMGVAPSSVHHTVAGHTESGRGDETPLSARAYHALRVHCSQPSPKNGVTLEECTKGKGQCNNHPLGRLLYTMMMSAAVLTRRLIGTFQRCSIPPKSPNGNGTGFQRVPVENPLNTDVAPVADPFFQPLLAVVCRCWFNGRC